MREEMHSDNPPTDIAMTTTARARDERHRAAALALLVPGFVHRMRNSLTLFSSHAQLLALGDRLAERASRSHAVLNAEVARAGRAIDLLATAHDEEHQEFRCLGSMARALADLYLWSDGSRELVLEADAHAQLRLTQEPRAWLTAITIFVDSLARSVPSAVHGSMLLEARATAQGPSLVVRFVTQKDLLPFPLTAPKLDAEFVTWLAKEGIRVEAGPGHIRVSENREPEYRI